LSSVPRGLETGYRARCNNISCRTWCDNIRICNGWFLCEECATSSEGPGKEPLNESNFDKLWIERSSDEYVPFRLRNPKFIDEEDEEDEED